jgi:hypothetical protein
MDAHRTELVHSGGTQCMVHRTKYIGGTRYRSRQAPFTTTSPRRLPSWPDSAHARCKLLAAVLVLHPLSCCTPTPGHTSITSARAHGACRQHFRLRSLARQAWEIEIARTLTPNRDCKPRCFRRDSRASYRPPRPRRALSQLHSSCQALLPPPNPGHPPIIRRAYGGSVWRRRRRFPPASTS